MQQYAIEYGSARELAEAVNALLGDGWIPLGPPFWIGDDAEGIPWFSQALVCGDTARRLERVGKETT